MAGHQVGFRINIFSKYFTDTDWIVKALTVVPAALLRRKMQHWNVAWEPDADFESHRWNVLFCRLRLSCKVTQLTEVDVMELNMQSAGDEHGRDAEDFFDVELFVDKR